jgi:bifunctional non-homologous end joining protein LigD
VTLAIPREGDEAHLEIEGRTVRVTNLAKPFWPELGISKSDLIQYYVDVAPALLPHVRERPMVMKRYPNGAAGKFFFMKRAPKPRPEWIETVSVEHGSGNVIDFPVIQDLAALVWVINLGCIDLNPWYSRRDDVHRPDFLHFDLDPAPGAEWKSMCEAALVIHEALGALGMASYVKTTGSRGLHVYVPIVRGPLQKAVWTFAKKLGFELAGKRPDLLTAEYRKAKRPAGRVLVDYNQNRWGSTLASVYSVRPVPRASVSTPVTWEELKSGVKLEDFTLVNVPARVRERGDLWAPLAPEAPGRFDLEKVS